MKKMIGLSSQLVQDIYDFLAKETFERVAPLIGRLQQEVLNQPKAQEEVPPPEPAKIVDDEIPF